MYSGAIMITVASMFHVFYEIMQIITSKDLRDILV